MKVELVRKEEDNFCGSNGRIHGRRDIQKRFSGRRHLQLISILKF